MPRNAAKASARSVAASTRPTIAQGGRLVRVRRRDIAVLAGHDGALHARLGGPRGQAAIVPARARDLAGPPAPLGHQVRDHSGRIAFAGLVKWNCFGCRGREALIRVTQHERMGAETRRSGI